jgi:hypothetical protein
MVWFLLRLAKGLRAEHPGTWGYDRQPATTAISGPNAS